MKRILGIESWEEKMSRLPRGMPVDEKNEVIKIIEEFVEERWTIRLGLDDHGSQRKSERRAHWLFLHLIGFGLSTKEERPLLSF